MFKYLAVLIGLLCLFFSVKAWWNFQPLGSEAEAISLRQACDFTGGEDVRYVTFQADMDTAHRLYRTGLAEPLFTSQSPDEVHQLSPEDAIDVARLESLLGCPVRFNGVVDPSLVGVMQVVLDHEDQDKPQELKSEKCIAPALGSGGRLFVLSRTFHGDAEASDQWAMNTSFEGRLSRLADIKRNASGVTHDVEFITNMMRSWGADVPADAYVILTEKSIENGYKRHVVPVAGSDFSMLLEVTEAEERQFAESGVITGLVKVQNGSSWDSAACALGVQLPDRVGVLTTESADQYNTGARSFYAFGIVVGLVLTGLGVGAIWLKQYLRKQNRAHAMAAMSQPQNDDRRMAA